MKDSFSALLMDSIRFEQWLRFYYMEDEEIAPKDGCGEKAASVFAGEPDSGSERVILRIPQAVMRRIADDMPEFTGLAQTLNDAVISAESSRSRIFAFIRERLQLDEAAFSSRVLQAIEDPDFRRALDAFHGYVQYLADNEKGESAPFFDEWMARFETWARENDIPFINSLSKYRPEMDALKHPELLETAKSAPESPK